MERVPEHWSGDDGFQSEWLAAAEMFWEQLGNALGSATGLGLRDGTRWMSHYNDWETTSGISSVKSCAS